MRDREQAARAAEAQRFNQAGMCQMVTRMWFDAPSVGDVDRDGDGDAVDGWKSEPEPHRHPGDRNPPRGTPASFAGGSSGHGHRAMNLGHRLVRSTDFDTQTKRFRAGVVGTGTLEEVERALGVTYLGWSSTISGQPIPHPPKTPTRVREARQLLKAAREVAKQNGRHRRVRRITEALDVLPWK